MKTHFYPQNVGLTYESKLNQLLDELKIQRSISILLLDLLAKYKHLSEEDLRYLILTLNEVIHLSAQINDISPEGNISKLGTQP